MFRSLFGSKGDQPGPPKNQIEVVCPACGAAQYEPRLVVSTFCKKCGVHLSIQRKKVVASNVTRSGVGMPNPWADAVPAAKPPVPAPTPVKSPAENPELEERIDDPLAAELTQPVSEEEAAEGGFGVFLKQQTSPAPPVETAPVFKAVTAPDPEPVSEPEVEKEAAVPAPAKETAPSAIISVTRPEAQPDLFNDDRGAEKRPQSNSPPPTPAPAPMTASTLQKMKSEGLYRNQYFKDAECFECPHKFKVSRSSRSTNCPSCGALICMEDVEINMPSAQPIKTRGDVLIRKRGQVSADSIICKDLRCQGTLEANVHASGDAIFKAAGTMIGEVHCRRFIIEKGADVTFLNEVHAEEVDVQARVTGSIFSSGSLVIGANGSVNGDVTARSVSIEPGGELNGGMSIVRGKPAAPPPPVAEG